jgi:hypothetical protein
MVQALSRRDADSLREETGPVCRTCGPLDPTIVVYTGAGWNEHQSCPFCKSTLLIWEKKPPTLEYIPIRGPRGRFIALSVTT